MLKDYRNYDAIGLAQLIKNKDLSPTELLQTAIAHAEQENPSINAIITKLYDYGQQQIDQGLPEGPFSGVPFLLKDLFMIGVIGKVMISCYEYFCGSNLMV